MVHNTEGKTLDSVVHTDFERDRSLQYLFFCGKVCPRRCLFVHPSGKAGLIVDNYDLVSDCGSSFYTWHYFAIGQPSVLHPKSETACTVPHCMIRFPNQELWQAGHVSIICLQSH